MRTSLLKLFLLPCLFLSLSSFGDSHKSKVDIERELLNVESVDGAIEESHFRKATLRRANPFFATKQIYNGSFPAAYNGLYAACDSERKGSLPCTPGALISKRFWDNNIFSRLGAWVLTLAMNCVGFSTDVSYSDGMCVSGGSNQLIQCSCDMNISVCCYMP